MSTIKSSAENLTLNADGSGNDIIFQSNGSNVATLDQAGLLTATTFAGSGASLTALPAAQVSGTHTSFTSTGIDDNADATAITIDSNEQVGIGVSSPSAPLQIRKRLSSVGQSTPETVLLLETDAGTGDMAVGNGTRILFKIADDETNPSVGASIDAVRADGDDSISSTDLVFSTSQNDETLDEAFRIISAGALQTPSFATDGSVYGFKVEGIDQQHTVYQAQDGNGNFDFHRFYNSSGYIGRIRWSSSSLSFENLSDYRKKENIIDMPSSTDRLKQLKPKRFNLIGDTGGITLDGFLAHEVSPVCPEAVSGEKDAVDEDGNPDYQMMDNSKLVPLLVKTIQELEARITAGGL